MLGGAAARQRGNGIPADHQRRPGINGALGDRDGKIDPSAALGKRCEHGELRRCRSMICQAQQEDLALVSVAEIEQDAGRADQFALVEAGELGGI